jgi:hypothetical protein
LKLLFYASKHISESCRTHHEAQRTTVIRMQNQHKVHERHEKYDTEELAIEGAAENCTTE